MGNRDLSAQVFDNFFVDPETGRQFDGHPDNLAVSYSRVVSAYPETANWPVQSDVRHGNGYVLGDGCYLFPNFNWDNPAFESFETE